MLLTSREMFGLNSVDLSRIFNHCTILMYYASDSIKKESKLGTHCDCTYSVHTGKFVASANSQAQNTPTVIYSVCGKRELNWSRRKRGKKCWLSDDWHAVYELRKDTVTIIHPDDEDPELPLHSSTSYQYQHACSGVKNDGFSIALVFRVVSSVKCYNSDTDIMVNNVNTLSEADERTYKRFSECSSEFHNILLHLYHHHLSN